MDEDVPVMVPLKEYERLKKGSFWLECLEDAGVSNWEGMGEAISIRRKRLGEDEDKHE